MKEIKTFIITLVLPIALIITGSCKKDECIKTEWQDDCFCTLEYDPVCGCDGRTYGNACIAECQGITEYTDGECE